MLGKILKAIFCDECDCKKRKMTKRESHVWGTYPRPRQLEDKNYGYTPLPSEYNNRPKPPGPE